MFRYMNQILSVIRVQDIIDIVIVALMVYGLFKILRDTRAEQLSKGIIVLLVLTKLSEWLELYTVNYILSNLMTVGYLAILIVFQPELRKGLEFIGRTSSIKNSILASKEETEETIEELLRAIGSLSRQKIGALIVIGRKTGLNEFVETGTVIDGKVSSGLLINIFIPNTPLHDGAVIIEKDRIVSASSILPLSEDNTLSRDLGTRHRAALGISERSDAVALVVSEETGSISVAMQGSLSRHLDIDTLKSILQKIYFKTNEGEEEEIKFEEGDDQ